MKTLASKLLLAGLLSLISTVCPADDHQHDHGSQPEEPVERPRVFLDKSPRIVWYQLNRLDNQRLLLVERATDDPKYAPVYTAILIRPGMSRQHREEALHGLVTLNKSDPVRELLAAIGELDESDRQQQRVGRQLAMLLLQQRKKSLAQNASELQAATDSEKRGLRIAGFGGLIVGGESELAWTLAKSGKSARLDYLNSIALVPSPQIRGDLRETVIGSLRHSQPDEVRRAAIRALAFVPAKPTENFQTIAPLVEEKAFRSAAVRTLLRIPAKYRDPQTAGALVDALVKHAESTPAAQRTTDEFIEAMQLADQLLALVPVETARAYRQRLREVTVRVVLIKTVEEEMRYDTPYFAAEAGRPVQVVLSNEDLMPHNLVVTAAGSMIREVAEEGAVVGPSPSGGKPYVPKSDQVLHATDMVQPGRQERLTFTAPQEPGEYPYVCTFPRHWMRMYGVMVVVEDLDQWLKNPTKPADPIGNTREFVKSWTIDDFEEDLAAKLEGRPPEIGSRIFVEATCALCHKYNGKGGAVGPELTDVFKRWKGDTRGVLREILDPSHKIDPKYAMHIVVTLDGKVVSGIVTAEDDESITILDNPESPAPTEIKQEDIDDIVKSPKSMMPKALLDQFTKEEILELLAFLKSGSQE